MSKFGKSERFSAAKVVYENIVHTLEQGEVVWSRPWINMEIPSNAISKRPYHGYNAMFLNFISSMKGYKTNRYLTYNQAKEVGANVKRGEHATGVVFVEVKTTVKKDVLGNPVIDAEGNPEKSAFFLSRYYSVFNIDQCVNVPESLYKRETFATAPIKNGEDIIKGYATMPQLEFGGDIACYIPLRDVIQMPHMESFKTSEGYYATLFHECVHSTGASTRLNRDLSGMRTSGESEEKYAKEELIAEIGAAILCNACGITPQVENAAAYCKSWLKAIKGMKESALMSAFTQAWKAAEYVQGNAATESAGTQESGETQAA